MRLCLKPDPDVLDRARDNAIGHARRTAGEIKLGQRQICAATRSVGFIVMLDELAEAVECAELDADLFPMSMP